MNNSALFDESTFYSQFTQDLLRCCSEVVIESPFITKERMSKLFPVFETLIRRGIRVYIFTRDPREHTESMEVQSEVEIQRFERLGVQVFLCRGNHHRKLAILDRKILWEGSLNILSQVKSREIMKRIEEEESAIEMFEFLDFARFI
ncbi:MAG: phospholipase D-like domain-containing protein [Candidatus Woesebacteria bacterium]